MWPASWAAGGARQEQATPQGLHLPTEPSNCWAYKTLRVVIIMPPSETGIALFLGSKHTHTVKTFDKVSLLLFASAMTTA